MARRREAPKSCRAGGGGEHRAWPGLQGAGGGGPNGPVLELSAGESRGGGALPPARPQACDLKAGGREPDDFEGGGGPSLDKADSRGPRVEGEPGKLCVWGLKRKHIAPFLFRFCFPAAFLEVGSAPRCD